MNNTHNKPEAIHWFMLVGLTFIWGSSFLLMKKGLLSFSSQQVASLRLAVTGIALLPALPLALKSGLHRSHWRVAASMGLFGSAIPAFLFTTAQSHISSSMAGMLNALTPFFTFSLGVLFFGLQYYWQKMLGLLLGLVGVVLLIVQSNPANSIAQISFLETAPYCLLIILATCCYAFNVNYIKKHGQGVSAAQLSAVAFFIISFIASSYLLSGNFVETLNTAPQGYFSLGCVIALGVLGSAVAGIMYVKITQETNILFAASVTYLMPLVALLLGWFDGEKITLGQIFGLCLVLVGVYVINFYTPKK